MSRNRPGFIWLHLVLAVAGLLTVVASAHDRTISSSVWSLAGDRAVVFLTMNAIDAAGLTPLPTGSGDAETALLERIGGSLVLLADGKPCSLLEPPSRLVARAGRVNARWSVSVPASCDNLAIRSDLLAARGSGHLHFATVRDEVGNISRHALAAPVWQVSDSFIPPQMHRIDSQPIRHLMPALRRLVEEPLSGWFLAALALASSRRRTLVVAAAVFLAGQAVAAVLVVMGIAHADLSQITILAPLSIVAMAVENIWLAAGPRNGTLPVLMTAMFLLAGAFQLDGTRLAPIATFGGVSLFLCCRHRWLLMEARSDAALWTAALVFGLVHGFAFSESSAAEGSSPALWIPTLIVAQATMLLILWPLLRAAANHLGPVVMEAGSATCLALGLWWTLDGLILARKEASGRIPPLIHAACVGSPHRQITPTRPQCAAGFAPVAALSLNYEQNQSSSSP